MVTFMDTCSPYWAKSAKAFLSSHLSDKSCSLRVITFPYLNEVELVSQRKKKFCCKSDFLGDAPFVLAIGGCVASSLLLPGDAIEEDDTSSDTMDSTDIRLAVMGIISFIPYFNWLSWVFALVDTGKPRYGLYTIVYLASYIRPFSGEDSWLPIFSVLLGIIHVQLETSVKYGEINLPNRVANLFSLIKRERQPLNENEDGDDEK